MFHLHINVILTFMVAAINYYLYYNIIFCVLTNWFIETYKFNSTFYNFASHMFADALDVLYWGERCNHSSTVCIRSPSGRGVPLIQRVWTASGLETTASSRLSSPCLFQCDGRIPPLRTEMKRPWLPAGLPGLQTPRKWAATTTSPRSSSLADAH